MPVVVVASKRFFLLVMLLYGTLAVHAQSRGGAYSREIGMSHDNDIFFAADYYYTAGQDLTYRRLAATNSSVWRTFHAKSQDTTKVVLTYQGGFKIFTPRNIDSPDVSTMDRPYAGWSFVRFDVSNFPSERSSNHYAIETGLVGRISGMGELQRWVHQVTDYETPKGWSSQIRDEAVINLYYSRYQEVLFYPDLDLVTQSSVQTGTGGNRISQDLTLRAFQFNNISNSSFTQSRVSFDKRLIAREKKKEAFVFLGMGADYVMSNIFIQGSLFKHHESIFTVPLQPFILRTMLGFMFSSQSITWNITATHLTKEVRNGSDHFYANIGMAVRF